MKVKKVKVANLVKQRKFVGANLRDLRLRNEFTQETLAQRCSIDRKTINRIENGRFSPSIDTLVRIAAACNTSPAALLKGIENL